MEAPPAPGPMLSRAASFNSRQDRALKDINGRSNPLNRSHELISSKKMDNNAAAAAVPPKATNNRPTNRYATVASRYAAPVQVLKLQQKSLASPDRPAAGRQSLTKVVPSAITGRTITLQQQQQPAEVKKLPPAVQTVVVCGATRGGGDAAAGDQTNACAKGSRLTKRISMIDRHPREQMGHVRSMSLDRGVCQQKEGRHRQSGVLPCGKELTGSSLLQSASHWLFLIKLAENEKNSKAILDLFRLAISLRAQPIGDIASNLKRCKEALSDHASSTELFQQFKVLQRDLEVASGLEVSATGVCEIDDFATTATQDLTRKVPVNVHPVDPPPSGDLNVVSRNTVVKKTTPAKIAGPKAKALTRSATFSYSEARGPAVKTTPGKGLVKTVKGAQTGKQSGVMTTSAAPGVFSVKKDPADAASTEQIGIPCRSSTGSTNGLSQVSSQVKTSSTLDITAPQQTMLPKAVGADGPNDSVLSEALHGDSGLTETSCLPPCTLGDTVVNLVTASTHSGQDSIGADTMEKPVDSLSEWLSVESGADAVECQSAPTHALTPSSTGDQGDLHSQVKSMDVETMMQEVVLCILSEDSNESPALCKGTGLNDHPVALDVERKCCQGEGGHTAREGNGLVSPCLNNESTQIANLNLEHVDSCNTLLVDSQDPSGMGLTVQTVCERKAETGQDQHDSENDSRATQLDDKPTVLNCKSSSPLITENKDSGSASVCRKGRGRSGSVKRKSVKSPGIEPVLVEESGAISATPPDKSEVTPITQLSSSSKEKRMLRGREVTPRFHLPKPSWKAIVEREMKGSRLKHLLDAAKEPSPLIAFPTDLESPVFESRKSCTKAENGGSSTRKAVSKNENSTNCSSTPKCGKTERKGRLGKVLNSVTNSEPNQVKNLTDDPTEGQNEGHEQNWKKDTENNKVHTEGTDSTAPCATPGSIGLRRSARLQSKVQARRNMVF